MTRRVFLGESQQPKSGSLTVLTPNENAANALDVPHLSPENVARLSLVGVRAANPIQVSQLSREAARCALGVADPAGVAGAMLPVVREVFRSGVDIDTEPSSPRAMRVFAAARSYRELLRDRGLIDPAEALREAAGSQPLERPFLVWGYPRLGADEVAFLDAIAADGSELYLPYAEDSLFAENRETAEELRRRGWEVESVPISAPWAVEGVSVAAHIYPNREAEVRGVLAKVKELLADGVSAGEISLVARDEASYGPTVLSVAREYGVPVRALYRVPLVRTRLGSWLSTLLEASASRFPLEQTAELLRHPFGPGLSAEQWREAREAQASGRQGWAEAGVDLESLDLARWPDEDDRGGWVARATAFLEEHGAYDRAADWSREVVALSHLEDALRWISSPEEQPERRGEFLSELEELLNLVSAPEHPVEDGVALDTPLSLFGARRRYVFVLGLAEGEFPAQVAEAAALDFHERKELARQGMVLESAAGRARRERLSFHMLLQVPTECLVLSYPRLVGRQPSLPSTYFGFLGLEPAPPETVPVASPEEARRAFLREEGNAHHDEVLELARERWRVEMRRESPEPFDEHDGVLGVSVEREGSFSVTELGDLARCGFRWWSGRLLGLSEPREVESPALIGSINHLALELAVDQAINNGANGENLRPAVIERLDACFEEAERRHGAYRIRSWGLRRAENLRLLRGAVEGDEFLLSGAEVVGVEKRFEGKWHGLPVRGRLDRVDRTPQGAVIVDYKSGSGASLPTPDFQLTVYEEAAGEDLSESPVTSAYYYSLSKGERVRIRKPDDEEREGVARRMEDALAAGTLPPDALEHDPRGQVCATCSFDVVCRRGPRLRNKAAREA